MSRKRGLFIVLEGIDASGSTTQAQLLATYLRGFGRKVVMAHEPSGGPAGMLIRLALEGRLSGPNSPPSEEEGSRPPAFTPLDVHTLALLFAADRTDHLETKVKPALEQGHHVVSDRYALSSLAYQGLHIDDDWLLNINRYAIKPDLTIYLDVPAQHADLRMRQSRVTRDWYEQLARQELVQRRYRQVIAAGYEELGRIETIDASQPIDSVKRRIRKLVDEVLQTEPEDSGQEDDEELVLF